MLHDAQVDKADDVFGVSLKATKCAKPELSVRELTKRQPVARPRKPIENLSCIPAMRLSKHKHARAAYLAGLNRLTSPSTVRRTVCHVAFNIRQPAHHVA